jgi:hypothetical protein
VGSAVIAELIKRGAEVRALICKPDASHKLPESVQAAIGDLLDPVSVEEAMKGIDKLFLLNAVTADELTQALITFGLAKRLKLKHMTYLSVFKVEQFRDVPHFASKLAVESALREFGVPHTVSREEIRRPCRQDNQHPGQCSAHVSQRIGGRRTPALHLFPGGTGEVLPGSRRPRGHPHHSSTQTR